MNRGRPGPYSDHTKATAQDTGRRAQGAGLKATVKASRKQWLPKALRRWWTGGHPDLLLRAQDKLIKSLVAAPAERFQFDGGINGIRFEGNSSSNRTLIMAHGFGSGLGFFFRNVDELLNSRRYGQVLLFDWLGMGGSDRPSCRAAPIRGWSEFSTSFCNSRFTPTQAVHFFIDPLQQMLLDYNIDNVTLVGHSLGGYLSARYALEHPQRILKLVLASPVGFPEKPPDALPQSQLPTGLRIVDALWSSNVTPQQLVRLMGNTRGKRNVQRALRGRIPHLEQSESDLLAEYLYHITVAEPSGEYAINSLLEPVASPNAMGVYAREPLHRLMSELDSNIEVSVMFGDQDWMRAPPNEASARRVINSLHVQKAQISESHAKSRVVIVPDAGHHLYLDNPKDFARIILSE